MKTSGWHALRYIHAWFILNLHSYKNILALVIMNNIYRFRHTFQIIIHYSIVLSETYLDLVMFTEESMVPNKCTIKTYFIVDSINKTSSIL